jgi:hypothetical protein
VPANLPPPWLSVQSLPSRAASAPFRPTPFLRSLIASLPLPSRPPPPNSSPFSSTPPRFASSSSVACSMLSPHQKRKERKKKKINAQLIISFLARSSSRTFMPPFPTPPRCVICSSDSVAIFLLLEGLICFCFRMLLLVS